jgi:hypothetical protein
MTGGQDCYSAVYGYMRAYFYNVMTCNMQWTGQGSIPAYLEVQWTPVNIHAPNDGKIAKRYSLYSQPESFIYDFQQATDC